MRENRNPILFAALLVFLSVQICGCGGGALAGVAGGVGRAALGAGKLALGATKGVGRVALGAARGAGKVALGAGKFALNNASLAPDIVDGVANATGSRGAALGARITRTSVDGAQRLAQGIRANRAAASYKAAPSLLGSSRSCPGGVCSGGSCSGGSCSAGSCSAGSCSGGSCSAGPGFGSGGGSLNGGDIELD